ncbi:hypothetical protein K4W23_001677, partial [Campylobacter jejuni]|nr:hypothetical protein [Campylobacter jejuni]
IFNKEFEYVDELFHQDKISFNNSTFNHNFVIRSNSKEINRELSFENVTFNKDFKLNNKAINKILNFNKAKFKNTLEIKNSNLFDNINLDNAIFYQGIDFSGSAFQKFVNFYESQIYKYCNFNATYFKYVPIFKTDITKQDIKIDIKFMTISDLSIDDLDKTIGAYTNFVSLFKKDFKNEESKIVKIFRENFSMFKGVLLSKYNSFEASNYKKQELYLKELELKYINKESLKKSKPPKIKDKLDILMLGINRATSDHHDDLYQIIMFTFAIIGGYFMLNCICAYSNEIVDIVQENVKYGKILFFFFVLFVNFLLVTMLILYWFFQIYFNMITVLRIIIQLMMCIIILEFIIQEAIIAILILVVYLLAKIYFKKFQLLFKLILFCIIVYLWYNHGYFSYIADLASDIQYVKFEYFLVITSFSVVFIAYVYICISIYRKRLILFFLASLGVFGIFYSPSIITPFLGAFSEDARNHYLYKAIDELDSQKALELSKQILAKEPTSELNAKKTLKDYKDELKSSKLLEKNPELKRAIAIDGGVLRLNIAYYLVLAFCIFALQKTMRKNSIIPS